MIGDAPLVNWSVSDLVWDRIRVAMRVTLAQLRLCGRRGELVGTSTSFHHICKTIAIRGCYDKPHMCYDISTCECVFAPLGDTWRRARVLPITYRHQARLPLSFGVRDTHGSGIGHPWLCIRFLIAVPYLLRCGVISHN